VHPPRISVLALSTIAFSARSQVASGAAGEQYAPFLLILIFMIKRNECG